MPQRRRMAGWWQLATALLAALVNADGRPTAAAELVLAATPARVSVLIDDMPAAGSLAAPATGQAVYVVDDAQGSVVGCDPFHPEKRWTVLPPAADAADHRPVAIACIDSSTLAAVVRDANRWALRTYRLAPPEADGSRIAPRTTHMLAASMPTDRPQVLVGLSRDWLLVTGFTPPGPCMQVFAIRGSQPAPASGREPLDQRLIVAAAPTPGNGLAVFDVDPSQADAAARVSLRAGLHPRPLLTLDTGLPGVRAAASSRTGGDLWVVGGAADSATAPEGLWRIEATLENRRQSVRAVCMARLEAPRDVVWISDRMLLVSHGKAPRRISHIDPSATEPSSENQEGAAER
jgi:hypothetical protein